MNVETSKTSRVVMSRALKIPLVLLLSTENCQTLHLECILLGVIFLFLLQAKFFALLIIVPWALDFVVHDYVLMPFLDR